MGWERRGRVCLQNALSAFWKTGLPGLSFNTSGIWLKVWLYRYVFFPSFGKGLNAVKWEPIQKKMYVFTLLGVCVCVHVPHTQPWVMGVIIHHLHSKIPQCLWTLICFLTFTIGCCLLLLPARGNSGAANEENHSCLCSIMQRVWIKTEEMVVRKQRRHAIWE